VIAQDFGGEVTLRYEPAGLRYELAAPMSNLRDVVIN
jgi:hypothetical protein